MSTAPQFQLFPSPSQNRPDGTHSRRTARKRTTKPPDVSPVVEETKSSGKAETVILQIIEDTKAIAPSTDAPQPDRKLPIASPSCIEGVKPLDCAQKPTTTFQPSPHSVRSQSPSAALSSNEPSRPPRTSSRSPSPLHNIAERTQPNGFTYGPPRLRSASIPSSGPDRSMAPTSVPAPSGVPATTDVPIRSIFPRYDSRVPLTQQHYYPPRSRSHDLPREVCSRTEYRDPGRVASEPFVAETKERDVSKLASTEDLVKLWDAANGKDPESSIGTINLCLCRVDTLTYTLGNSSVPLYTLKANSKNDIQIHRTHPSRSNTKAPVVTLGLGEIDQYNNESATITLFPKLAEIFAREQALELSRRNQLDPPRAMQAENDAVKRVEAQESCVLRWNATQCRYDLYHQAFTLSDGAAPGLQKNDDGHNPPGVLHLTIRTPFASNSPSLRQRPTIVVTAPLTSEDKSSTHSLPGVDTPLMALDLNTMALSISTNSVLSTIPSQYALDALIATILTVTVFDDATSPVLKDMTIRGPKAASSPGSYGIISPALESIISTSDAAGNPLVNQAQREEDEQEAALMTQIQSQQTRPKSSSRHPWKWSKLNPFGWGTASDENGIRMKIKPKMRSERHPISVDEIDLEQAGRYGKFKFRPPVVEEKPQRPRKKKVRFVVWVFSLLVSGLTMFLKFITWILVGFGRCVTGKKA